MDVSVSFSDAKIQVKIVGSVKLTDADLLFNAFQKVLSESDKNVDVDLALVPSMSSLGIGKIIFLNQRLEKQNRKMLIIGIHRNLLNLFRSMKLDRIITIE